MNFGHLWLYFFVLPRIGVMGLYLSLDKNIKKNEASKNAVDFGCIGGFSATSINSFLLSAPEYLTRCFPPFCNATRFYGHKRAAFIATLQ